jgi:F-type H+-transporting ATPase subunit a
MESLQNYFKNLWARFMGWVQANPTRAGLWAAAIIIFLVGFFINVPEPHVALSGEALLVDGPWWFTNSLLTTLIVDLVVIVLALLATTGMKVIPTGWQNFVEMVIEWLYSLAESVSGANARKFFPWVATIFIFVIISNWSGLIPGVGPIGIKHPPHGEGTEGEHAWVLNEKLAMADGKLIFTDQPVADEAAPAVAEEGAAYYLVPLFRAPSADLNVTFALAITTIVLVQIWGVRTLGSSYFNKFINFTGPNGFMKGINGFVGILEIISEFSRILAFGFRLFGNIFAGEIVLATMAFLVTFFLPVPFYVLEVFIGFVQALVFTMLALVFFHMATISHGHAHEDEHDHGHAAAH